MKKKIKAPKGFHFMKSGKTYKLMKHEGKFKPHKGASLTAEFEVQKKSRPDSARCGPAGNRTQNLSNPE